MKPPECTDHGTAVLDLALGLLDDRAADDAEAIRMSCMVCGRWWDDHLAGEPAAEIDSAVADAFSVFKAPRSRRSPVWLAAAAAAVLAVGGGLLWSTWSPSLPASTPAELVRSLFDGTADVRHDLNGDGTADASDLVTSVLSAK